MKNQLQGYMELVKNFMRKHYLLFLSAKVLKLLIVLFLFSCGSSQEPSQKPDTVLIDSIPGNAPEDSVIYKNEEEEEEEKEEENSNPMVPEEG